jgi:hypothetical protein
MYLICGHFLQLVFFQRMMKKKRLLAVTLFWMERFLQKAKKVLAWERKVDLILLRMETVLVPKGGATPAPRQEDLVVLLFQGQGLVDRVLLLQQQEVQGGQRHQVLEDRQPVGVWGHLLEWVLSQHLQRSLF